MSDRAWYVAHVNRVIDHLDAHLLEPGLAAVVHPGVGRRATVCAIAAALTTGAAAIAAAQPAPATEVIRACQPGTPAHADAAKALAVLDAEIRKLTPAADPAAPAKRLEALGEQPCFKIVASLALEPKSGLALRTWWEDGGHAFVAGALDLAGDEPISWVAPDVRRALTRETAPAHRLAPLLCPAYDGSCGRDTDGWRLRAEAALDRAARARHPHGDGPTLVNWKQARAARQDDCLRYAHEAPRLQQLARYQYCLDATAHRAPAFAIGRVKKPIDGWLVVSGRRGHHRFCDELRAFDLATGAAYRVASCSGLALRPGGDVDHRATDAGRRLDRERGTVSVDEIREAAWMLLQLGELDDSVLTHGFGAALPRWIPRESDGVRLGAGSYGGDVAGSDAETQLTWRVDTRAGKLGAGTITWPRDLNDDAEAYATELLDVAEHSFTPGCPPAVAPTVFAAQLRALSANHLDTDTKSLNQAASSLDKTWRDLVGERCARP